MNDKQVFDCGSASRRGVPSCPRSCPYPYNSSQIRDRYHDKATDNPANKKQPSIRVEYHQEYAKKSQNDQLIRIDYAGRPIPLALTLNNEPMV